MDVVTAVGALAAVGALWFSWRIWAHRPAGGRWWISPNPDGRRRWKVTAVFTGELAVHEVFCGQLDESSQKATSGNAIPISRPAEPIEFEVTGASLDDIVVFIEWTPSPLRTSQRERVHVRLSRPGDLVPAEPRATPTMHSSRRRPLRSRVHLLRRPRAD